MQATLEAESKGKQEALRIKKKLESDINVYFFYIKQKNFRNLKSLWITQTKPTRTLKKLLKSTKIFFANFNFKLKMNNVSVMKFGII